jgi:DNA recombination protein RmuC
MLDPLSLSVGIGIGLLVGALICYLVLNQKLQKQNSLLQKSQMETEVARQTLADFRKNTESDRLAYDRREQKIIQLTADLSKMSADYDNLSQRMLEREKEVNNLQQHFQAQFEMLANRILKTNTQELSSHNQDQLKQMLQPLRERLHSFEQKVSDTYEKEARERFHLQKEIEQLMSMNLRMSEDAQNLTRALRGESKTQGNWGEMILSRVLESSGLRPGEEFETQVSLKSENGDRLQPDVLVHLPDDRKLIVDAKVSLTAYERFLLAEEEDQQQEALQQHLQSIHTHIRQLSSKHYHSIPEVRSPDFVLLFMPIEAAFSLALQADPELFSQAWERQIVITSPTTLLACLKTVASIWKLEHQNANAMEIARQGGLLYDKFVGFVEEMEKIGKHLDQASRSHDDAMRKLSGGKGNLLGRAEKLREMGVKNKKQLKEPPK